MQPGLEIRNQASISEAVSLGALSVHKSIRHVCKPSGIVLQGPVAWPHTCDWVLLQGPKHCPAPSHGHNLPLILWFSQSLLHSPIWRAMRSDGLSQGGSLNNYFALIKKGNASLGGAALNAEVGVMDAGPPPT